MRQQSCTPDFEAMVQARVQEALLAAGVATNEPVSERQPYDNDLRTQTAGTKRRGSANDVAQRAKHHKPSQEPPVIIESQDFRGIGPHAGGATSEPAASHVEVMLNYFHAFVMVGLILFIHCGH